MISPIHKYHKKMIQLCFLKVALLFSVCLFSGFNGQSSSIFPESITTELVESRKYDQSSNTFNLQKQKNQIISTEFLSNSSFCKSSWAVLHFRKSLATQYKSICKEYISYKFRFMKFLTRISVSSDDEMLSFS